MKNSLIPFLRCTCCKESNFQVIAELKRQNETLSGSLRCLKCNTFFPIVDGIAQFPLQDERVLRETVQWEVLAKSEGWLAENPSYLESLPSAGSNTLVKNDSVGWIFHEYNFFRVIEKINTSNKFILDFGAGRCWSAKWLTLRGGRVIAFDALLHPTIGLGAGQVFIKNHNIYFERVKGDFNNMPFLCSAFDMVVCSGSLHHTIDISTTLQEIARVLKPGGCLVLINEPVGGCLKWKERIKVSQNQEGINEHAYRMAKICSLLRRNNFALRSLIESIAVYDPRTSFYQGFLGSCINSCMPFRHLFLLIRGGVLNAVFEKIK